MSDLSLLWLPCLFLGILITAVNVFLNLNNKTRFTGTAAVMAMACLILSLAGEFFLVNKWILANDIRAIYDVFHRTGFGQIRIYIIAFALNIFFVIRKKKKDN